MLVFDEGGITGHADHRRATASAVRVADELDLHVALTGDVEALRFPRRPTAGKRAARSRSLRYAMTTPGAHPDH